MVVLCHVKHVEITVSKNIAYPNAHPGKTVMHFFTDGCNPVLAFDKAHGWPVVLYVVVEVHTPKID